MSAANNHVPPKKGFLSAICRCCDKNAGKVSDAKKHAVVQDQNPEVRLKKSIRKIVEGQFVTIIMTLVTLFALVGVSYRFFQN